MGKTIGGAGSICNANQTFTTISSILNRPPQFVRLYKKITNLPMVPCVVVDWLSLKFAVEQMKRENSLQPHALDSALTSWKPLNIISNLFTKQRDPRIGS